MAELCRIVTASERDLADTLDEMQADPEAGQRIPARAAVAHLNRPERERGSVLSTVVRHTAWLDDPRLCAVLARSDFNLAEGRIHGGHFAKRAQKVLPKIAPPLRSIGVARTELEHQGTPIAPHEKQGRKN
jgi:hypothetical protein